MLNGENRYTQTALGVKSETRGSLPWILLYQSRLSGPTENGKSDGEGADLGSPYSIVPSLIAHCTLFNGR